MVKVDEEILEVIWRIREHSGSVGWTHPHLGDSIRLCSSFFEWVHYDKFDMWCYVFDRMSMSREFAEWLKENRPEEFI